MDGKVHRRNLETVINETLAKADVGQDINQELYWAIRGFLADKFSTAMLIATREDAARLNALFKIITGED